MKNLKIPVLIILGSLILWSCKQEKAVELMPFDLLPHGMPIVIRAPEDPEIKKHDLVFSRDITIRKDDFNLQIFESEALTRDIPSIKARMLAEVKGSRYFAELLREDDAGFIYRTEIDTNYINYGFRFVRLQGDKEYVFQQGLQGKFSLEAVETMYQAVQ